MNKSIITYCLSICILLVSGFIIVRFLDQKAYEKLKEIDQSEYVDRIVAYQKYLSTHRYGKHRDGVNTLITQTIREYYEWLKQQTAIYDKKEDYKECTKICNEFLSNTPYNKFNDEVTSLQESCINKANEKRLAEREKKRQLDEVIAYSKETYIDVIDRIERVREYIRKYPSGKYIREARVTLKSLKKEAQSTIEQLENEDREQEILANIHKKQQESLKRLERERQQKLARIQKKRQQRLAQEEVRVWALVQNSGDRFAYNKNGVVTDRKTGLMWCAFNSYVDLNRCVDYKSALKYVKGLTTGGYRDWRLPIERELVRIYKNKPFFLSGGVKWHWTSATSEEIYRRRVHIVNTRKETRWNMGEYANPKECGAVRAVRP